MLMQTKSILPKLLPAAVALLAVPFVSANTQTEADMAAKIAQLEKRLADMEARLSDTEQETKEVKVLATNVGSSASAGSYTMLHRTFYPQSCWRNLR